jgi:hypothetical protein
MALMVTSCPAWSASSCRPWGVIVQFVRAQDYRYYFYTIVARSFILLVMTFLYFKARNPLFLVLDAIVPFGLLNREIHQTCRQERK